MSHYYTDNTDLPSDRKSFEYHFGNEIFRFTTDNGVFSKGGVDYGSYLLIKSVYELNLGEKCLDLGCGFGPIGIIVQRFNPKLEVDAVDVNSRACELTSLNSEINGANIKVYHCQDILTLTNKYDSIILNPPIRAGKSVIYGLYEKSHEKLVSNGSLYIVIQKKQGAMSTIDKLETLFSEVKILDNDGGYFVIQAIK